MDENEKKKNLSYYGKKTLRKIKFKNTLFLCQNSKKNIN